MELLSAVACQPRARCMLGKLVQKAGAPCAHNRNRQNKWSKPLRAAGVGSLQPSVELSGSLRPH